MSAPPNEASAADRTHRAACAATIVFLVLYTLPLAIEVPSLWYLPLERRWVLGLDRPPGLIMDWYGRTLLAGLAAAGMATAVARVRAPLHHPRRWALAVAAALAVALSAYALTLYHRVLPAPVPATSAPRAEASEPEARPHAAAQQSGLLRRTISG